MVKMFFSSKKLAQVFLLLSSIFIVNCTANKEIAINQFEQSVSQVKNKTSDWSDIFQQSKNSVVQIFSYTNTFNFLEPYKAPEQGQGCGSGFFISEDGYILTNFHVVADAVALFIQLPELGREQFEAEYVGATPGRDIALLRLTDKSFEALKKQMPNNKIAYLPLGNSDTVVEAQRVMLMGYPLGQQNIKASIGEISGREITPIGECLQTTIPTNAGNSGGPVVDMQGNVIALCVMKIAQVSVEGISYVIEINSAKTILAELLQAKIVRKPYWGIEVSPTTEYMLEYFGCPLDGGVYVEDVKKKSLAERAGIQIGDIIYQIMGYNLDRHGYVNALWRGNNDKVIVSTLLERIPFGDTVKIGIYRNGKPLECSVEVKNESPFAVDYVFPWYEKIPDFEVFGGMVVMDLTINHLMILSGYSQYMDLSALAKYEEEDNRLSSKVIICSVIPNSQLHKARAVRLGSVIEEVNGISISTLEDFRAAIVQTKGNNITVKTESGAFVVLPVSEILADEPALSKRYCYEISPLFYKLLQA